jgi:hypothetical protein
MAKPSNRLVALRTRRVVLVNLLIAGTGLLVAACGASPSSSAVAHLSTTTTQAKVSQAKGSPSLSGVSSSGGAGPSGGQSSTFSMARGNEAAMLAYAQCMRSHGVANFPDPNGQGVIQGSGIDVGSASFQAADKACRHVLPNGGQPTPAQQAKALAQALRFSQCMRSHGISGFPDPQTQPGGGIAIRLQAGPGSNLNPQSPQFQGAQKACQGLIGQPFGAASAKGSGAP